MRGVVTRMYSYLFGGSVRCGKETVLKPELDVLKNDINFKGAFIPYTFENRDGYQEVESVASYLAGNITAGVSRRGQIFSYNS